MFCLKGFQQSGVLQQAKVQRRHLRLSTQPTSGSPQQPHADYQQHSWQEADTFTAMLANLMHSRASASTARAVGMLHHHLATSSQQPLLVEMCLLVHQTYLQAASTQAYAPCCKLGLVQAWALCLFGYMSLQCLPHQRWMQTRPKQRALLQLVAYTLLDLYGTLIYLAQMPSAGRIVSTLQPSHFTSSTCRNPAPYTQSVLCCAAGSCACPHLHATHIPSNPFMQRIYDAVHQLPCTLPELSA